jgi:5S rRNA maturation endonuclease (ribonuclease M5)
LKNSSDTQELLELIERKKHLLTICEGKRDVAALKRLGFTDVIELDAALYKIVERFGKKTIVQILTDLDAEGKRLYSKLSSDLKQRGVHVDNELREALFKTQLRQVEGLYSYIQEF